MLVAGEPRVRAGQSDPEDESEGTSELHVKTLIGVTCSETSFGRTVLTFHGPCATSNTRVQGVDAPTAFYSEENSSRGTTAGLFLETVSMFLAAAVVFLWALISLKVSPV